MSIALSIESNMSLADIQAARQDGLSVVRTHHEGNNRAYNLAIAAAGIAMQGVDHTIVAQLPGEHGDNNYLPGSIVTHNGVTPLDVDRTGALTMQTTATDPRTGQRMYLDQLHANALRAAFPDTAIITNTEYIRAAESISREVIGIALAEVPQLFVRATESDGTIRRAQHGNLAHLAVSYGILQLSDDPHLDRGVLIPNAVDIVLGFVVEALRHGGDTQLHLSGPDFCHYAKDPGLQATLNQLYTALRSCASFGMRLPEELNVKIIPATAARFVAPLGREDSLRQIFTLLEQDSALDGERRTYFSTHRGRNEESERFVAQNHTKQLELHQALGDAALAAADLFIGPRDAPFVSQYDVLQSGGLYIPPENLHLSMHELDILHRRLTRAREAAIRRQQV